jgi:transposase-like protein
MGHDTTSSPALPVEASRDTLTALLRQGSQRLLAAALEAEVEDVLSRYAEVRDGDGRRLVVRNGHLPEREIQTGLGPVAVRQPRVADRRPADAPERLRFRSAILPPYLRRTKSLDELIPWLYLKGISTGDFGEALAALLGPQAKGLSPTTVVRLKADWEAEYREWSRRSLAGKHYVYLWVDGIWCNVRLEDERCCLLVVIGATADGAKELLAVHDGLRESEQSWSEVLLDLKGRGLLPAPQVAVGDGALGFWKALRKVFPATREQRCWVHKTANVLNALPKRSHGEAKRRLQDIWMAASRADAERALELFVAAFQAKYPKATECLLKDREVLLTFYDFPAEHWRHLRTTNPIESTFASVRLRTVKTKGAGSRLACLTMVVVRRETPSHPALSSV